MGLSNQTDIVGLCVSAVCFGGLWVMFSTIGLGNNAFKTRIKCLLNTCIQYTPVDYFSLWICLKAARLWIKDNSVQHSQGELFKNVIADLTTLNTFILFSALSNFISFWIVEILKEFRELYFMKDFLPLYWFSYTECKYD